MTTPKKIVMGTTKEISTGQAAKLTGLSAATIVRYCDTGAIKRVRRLPSGYRRIPVASLQSLMPVK